MRGLSKARLKRMHQVLSGYVEREEIPGLVALVSRDDEVHVEVLGILSVGGRISMQRNTIFRIASLTKPITAVAAMILVEECKLRLDESIEPWLTELANRRVLKSIGSPLDDTVPAKRAITVRDLLTFRMGFGSVMARPGTYPIQKLIREYRIGGDGPPVPAQAPATDEWLRRLGSLPLMAQPGERWLYHVSSDVLGVLIARVSGQSLGAFMRERIFDPSGHEGHCLPRSFREDRTTGHVLFLQSAKAEARRLRRRAEHRLATGAAVRSRRGRTGVDRGRLLRFQSDDAEQGATGPRTNTFPRLRGAHDLGPTHARAALRV